MYVHVNQVSSIFRAVGVVTRVYYLIKQYEYPQLGRTRILPSFRAVD